jgi:hypothetical protein
LRVNARIKRGRREKFFEEWMFNYRRRACRPRRRGNANRLAQIRAQAATVTIVTA